jgi:hypothetical protein
MDLGRDFLDCEIYRFRPSGQCHRHSTAGFDLSLRRKQVCIHPWAFEQLIGAVWHYVDSNPAMSPMWPANNRPRCGR